MDYQSLHIKTVVELRKLAKLMGVRVPAGTSKSVLIELLLEADRAEAEKAAAKRSAAEAAPAADKPAPEPAASEVKAPENPTPKRRGRPPKARPAETAQSGNVVPYDLGHRAREHSRIGSRICDKFFLIELLHNCERLVRTDLEHL